MEKNPAESRQESTDVDKPIETHIAAPAEPKQMLRVGDFRALPSDAWHQIHSAFRRDKPAATTVMPASCDTAVARIADFRTLPKSAWIQIHAPFQQQ